MRSVEGQTLRFFHALANFIRDHVPCRCSWWYGCPRDALAFATQLRACPRRPTMSGRCDDCAEFGIVPHRMCTNLPDAGGHHGIAKCPSILILGPRQTSSRAGEAKSNSLILGTEFPCFHARSMPSIAPSIAIASCEFTVLVSSTRPLTILRSIRSLCSSQSTSDHLSARHSEIRRPKQTQTKTIVLKDSPRCAINFWNSSDVTFLVSFYASMNFSPLTSSIGFRCASARRRATWRTSRGSESGREVPPYCLAIARACRTTVQQAAPGVL